MDRSPIDDGNPVRVLVVEDHPALAFALRELLGSDERLIVVGCVATGRDAVAHEALDVVDVVLSDVHLPDTDGIALMLELQRAQPAIAVIIMSGSGAGAASGDALSGGAFAYLEKGDMYVEVCDLIVEAARRGASPRSRAPRPC